MNNKDGENNIDALKIRNNFGSQKICRFKYVEVICVFCIMTYNAFSIVISLPTIAIAK